MKQGRLMMKERIVNDTHQFKPNKKTGPSSRSVCVCGGGGGGMYPQKTVRQSMFERND